MRKNLEHYEQVALFQWIELHKNKYKGLDLAFAVPNGANTSPRIGKWMKDEGLKSGVPDIVIPVSRDCYHGLWIEMKVEKRKLSNEQRNYIVKLQSEGHRVEVCYNWEDAAKIITAYLKEQL